MIKKNNVGFYIKSKEKALPKGLNFLIIRIISAKKKEPQFLTKFRLSAYKQWKLSFFPLWSKLLIPEINFQNISYYSEPATQVKDKVLQTFKNLGVTFGKNNSIKKSIDDLKRNSKNNEAKDIVFDSMSINTTFSEKLSKEGIIFCSLSYASRYFSSIIKPFLGSVVPCEDNFFSSMNSAIFSDGSFCFSQKNAICPVSLSTYFRINSKKSGQFERTLIIAESKSSLKYLETCTAAIHASKSLHAAVVELIAFDKAIIRYSTVQNWYSGNSQGIGGVYNFVTKRGLCLGKKSEIHWTQVEAGSSLTWKYPGCVLVGADSVGSFLSLAITKGYQQADTGTKMIHLGNRSKSSILSKGVSCNSSRNIYRGLVKIGSEALMSKNFSQCDSFLIGSSALSFAYPYIICGNNKSSAEHEASISKIAEEELFYILQRGIEAEKAPFIIISAQCKTIFDELPFEIAAEAKSLLF